MVNLSLKNVLSPLRTPITQSLLAKKYMMCKSAKPDCIASGFSFLTDVKSRECKQTTVQVTQDHLDVWYHKKNLNQLYFFKKNI